MQGWGTCDSLDAVGLPLSLAQTSQANVVRADGSCSPTLHRTVIPNLWPSSHFGPQYPAPLVIRHANGASWGPTPKASGGAKEVVEERCGMQRASHPPSYPSLATLATTLLFFLLCISMFVKKSFQTQERGKRMVQQGDHMRYSYWYSYAAIKLHLLK